MIEKKIWRRKIGLEWPAKEEEKFNE